MPNLTASSIVNILKQLDSEIDTAIELSVVLCGSSAILLQDIDFRMTVDIDFVDHYVTEVQVALQKFLKAHGLPPTVFDFRAAGVFQCLVDIDERYVPIELGLKHIRVYAISVFVWVASKLNTKKLDDIYRVSEVSNYLLHLVAQHMGDFCGVNEQAALNDLHQAQRDTPFSCVGFYGHRQITADRDGVLYWNNRTVETSLKLRYKPSVELLEPYRNKIALFISEGTVLDSTVCFATQSTDDKQLFFFDERIAPHLKEHTAAGVKSDANMSVLLMLADKPVYDVTNGQTCKGADALIPWVDGIGSYENWVKSRAYVVTNRAAEQIVKRFGGNSPEVKRRLSLSDSYWLKYPSDNSVFKDVTPYLVEFSKVYTVPVKTRSSAVPELVLGGSLPKVWDRDTSGATILRKVDLSENIQREANAIKLAQSAGLAVNGVADHNNAEIALRNISSLEWSMITFAEAGLRVDGIDVLAVAQALGTAGVSHKQARLQAIGTIVFDAIVGNRDRRHNMGNWAFLKNNSTGKADACPMYDFNLANGEYIDEFMHIKVSNGIKKIGWQNTAIQIAQRIHRAAEALEFSLWTQSAKELSERLSRNEYDDDTPDDEVDRLWQNS